MKIRNGFVANSSSSSYTCNVCQETVTGWDLCLSEAEMDRCENDHIFCTGHRVEKALSLEEKKVYLLRMFGDWNEDAAKKLSPLEGPELEWYFEDDGYDTWAEYKSDYGLPEKYCPICSFLEISNYDIARYLEKLTGVTRDSVFAQVKATNKRRKKLYDTEYVSIVCIQDGLDLSKILEGLKSKFETYSEFLEYVKND